MSHSQMFRRLPQGSATASAVALLLVASATAWGQAGAQPLKSGQISWQAPRAQDGAAEARLIEIYRLIARGSSRLAIEAAEKLVKDHPNFQLAQLVHGDLLTARVKPVRMLGDIPDDLARTAHGTLQDLRSESQLRISALNDRPPADSIPSKFVALSARNKHAIAIDVSKARLYLFENSRRGAKLLGDYYISVGKAGVGKTVEGDQRTPLGLYFITSSLDPKSLKDLYGSGALPINYPNAFDVRRGKTGSGIWLHGTPSSQFSRAPLATDGCIAVANPDLDRIIRTVEIRTTPVLIDKNLTWVTDQSLAAERKAFEALLRSWAVAKSAGEHARLLTYYAADFSADGKDLAAYASTLQADIARAKGRAFQLNDISFLRSVGEAEIMVATFGEVIAGSRAGRTIRQYWERRGTQWKILYEGIV
jgi:L,D-peptidoglycan transpeptidase YkuD (ErfK/YbiS/YcfS/YnhG family)